MMAWSRKEALLYWDMTFFRLSARRVYIFDLAPVEPIYRHMVFSFWTHSDLKK